MSIYPSRDEQRLGRRSRGTRPGAGGAV